MSEEILQLIAGDPERDALVVGKVVLVFADEPVTLELIVPTQPVGFEGVLPILQGLTDFVVDRSVVAAEVEGRTISCRAGCGACCRQLVPVSQAEARALAALVEAMPEPRRGEVHRRFDEALQSLHAAGVVVEIDAAREDTADTLSKLGIRYFGQGVACPFLEEESCSIHPDRPLSCRQYLVTSPAANCISPSPTTIELVRLPTRPSKALMLADADDSGETWMPLIYALAYTGQIAPAAPTRTASNILGDIFARFQETPPV